MSVFDRLIPKGAGEQERRQVHPTPYKKRFSELEASGREMKRLYPDDCDTLDDFVASLKEYCKARYKEALDAETGPMKAHARFFLTKDRMGAYACVIPPENGGNELLLDEFMEDMFFEGISFGVLEDEIQQQFQEGYLHIFPVARGTSPSPGEDGKITELFQRNGTISLEAQHGSDVDFGQGTLLQPIRQGTVICLIRPPRPGKNGMDVTGQELPSPPACTPEVPQGKNTQISRGGQALCACVDGILYIENDQFCIHEQKIIEGDLDQFQGVLRISGNLYVEGNVDGGVEVEASGEIVVNGKIGRARLTSLGGTIRIQKGIYGTKGETVLNAAGQVQSPVMQWAEIDAGTGVTAETISNCSIRCEGSVYAMKGRGMIVDSVIRAGESVQCLRIGNLAGGRSQLSAGYPPHLQESREQVKKELAQVQSTVEMLWESITNLRKKGGRMSDQERYVLEQLVEQRALYAQRRETLTAELKAANKELGKKPAGNIQCEKLFPVLEVQIGKAVREFTAAVEHCVIQGEDSKILCLSH